MTPSLNSSLTARSLTDLVELIPTLLGFHPANSVVVIVVVDDHVAVTARVDLPSRGVARIAEQLRPVWDRFPRGRFVVVICAPVSERSWAACDILDATLPGTGRTLIMADGHRWFAHPQDPGVPYEHEASAFAAATVMAGHQIRHSRADLVAELAPVNSAAEVSQALEQLRSTGDPRSAVVARALALVAAADAEQPVLRLDQAVVLLVASHDEAFLDAVMFSTTPSNASARRDLWAEVVRQSVPGCTGFALAALALAAWVCGQGALQVICLEQMMGQPGPDAWYETLSDVNARALPPAEWPTLRAALFRSASGVNPGGLAETGGLS
ncbi:MAG: DUF4192 family protein [Propioniciclava sp.]